MSEKIRKHNPKPGKVCVGDFLFMLMRNLSELIHNCENSIQIKNAQTQIMNEIFIQVAQNWCKCPSCKNRSAQLMNIVNAYNDEVERLVLVQEMESAGLAVEKQLEQ
jgi:hypothetical protein